MADRDRRGFLIEAGGLLLAGLSITPAARAAGTLLARPVPRRARRAGDIVEIGMRSDARGAKVWFDPIGVLVRPGQTVRWTLLENVHSTTAYHPDNDGHARRIPAGAEPWDSGILTEPGATFELALRLPGVYDYYCKPHEHGGMVGRIVVHDGGRGELPAAEFPDPGEHGWKPVTAVARDAFPPVATILADGAVRI